MTRRIEWAKALLRRGDLTVTEVCFGGRVLVAGVVQLAVHQLVGESPSAYRARSHDQGVAIPACFAKILTRPIRNGETKPAVGP